MKTIIFVAFGLLVVVCGIMLGCGQQIKTPTATSSTTSAATITLSGSLGTGVVASGIKSKAAASGYKVVAVDNGSGQTYSAATDSSGNFSLDIPSNISYEVSIIDSDSKYFGPIVMEGNSASSEVVVGIIPIDNTNLGTITVDNSGKKYAKPNTGPSGIINSSDKAAATGGTPKGTSAGGKTIQSGITNRTTGADLDKDGIPNIFDADDDNDGIRNGIVTNPFGPALSSSTVESVFLSSNIWTTHGVSAEAKNDISMWVNVYAKSGKLDEIQSVQCINVPASIKDIATIRVSSSIGNPSSYPAENSLWKNDSYRLHKTTTLTSNQWIVSITPKAIMNIGDIFVIRVTYTNGGYEDFFISTSYVLTDWSRLQTYNGTTMPTLEGNSSTPLAVTTSSVDVVFNKPKDEDGNTLKGLTYSISVGKCTNTSAPYGVPSSQTETKITDAGDSFSTVSTTISLPAAGVYYVVPIAESKDGQRNGEQIWFEKQ
ncbi:MAG: hypothetical protein FD145_1148 [Candidatus Saganbacteria bacterium]|uniref:Uncharacterized protein n=1 Tax=Candidatus Saganbacteria bacterium TaxID=2575572 RepID=A0A833L0N0_UNCSA|nr:MAG: hypothetical protein FD145_1148 [Candidatus Saganbacteria bacterium]